MCFSYHLDYAVPDATVAFILRRSDADQIYAALVRQRQEIEAAFGGALRWLREAHCPLELGPSPALVWTVLCPPLRDLDRSQWPALHAQMSDAMVRLERAVVPYLQPWLIKD